MNRQEQFDLQADTLLPRIYNKDENAFYFPVFSELGITYERKDKPIKTEKDLKNLNYAFSWHFAKDNDETYMEFRYRIDRCSGIRDINDKLIYENDHVEDNFKRSFVVYYNQHFLRWCLKPYNKKAIDYYRYAENLIDEALPMFDWIRLHNPLKIVKED